MSTNPTDPRPGFRARLRARIARHVEPTALRLLDWSNASERRTTNLEHRLEALEARQNQEILALTTRDQQSLDRLGPLEARAENLHWGREALVERLNRVDAVLVEILTRLDAVEADARLRVEEAHQRADEAAWGREALVERLNFGDARHEVVGVRIRGIEEKVEEGFWSREALIERVNRADDSVDRFRLDLTRLHVELDEVTPLSAAFGLDALAMGRRLASIEDQLERIEIGGEAERPEAARLPYPPPIEKAAG